MSPYPPRGVQATVKDMIPGHLEMHSGMHVWTRLVCGVGEGVETREEHLVTISFELRMILLDITSIQWHV